MLVVGSGNKTGPDLLISTFSSFEQKRYAGPSLIFNVPYCCTEGGASGIIGDVFLVFESGLLAVWRFAVLANDGIGVLNR